MQRIGDRDVYRRWAISSRERQTRAANESAEPKEQVCCIRSCDFLGGAISYHHWVPTGMSHCLYMHADSTSCNQYRMLQVLSFGVFIQPFARGDKGFQYSLTNNLLVWHMQSLSYLVMVTQ